MDAQLAERQAVLAHIRRSIARGNDSYLGVLETLCSEIEAGRHREFRGDERPTAPGDPAGTESGEEIGIPIPPPRGSVGVQIWEVKEMERSALVRVAPEGRLAPHAHEGEREDILVLEGDGELCTDFEVGVRFGEAFPFRKPIGAGDVAGVRPGFRHAVLAGPRGISLLCSLSADSEDDGLARLVREIALLLRAGRPLEAQAVAEKGLAGVA